MRSCKPRSASCSPEIRAYLDEHDLSLTDAIREWYSNEIGNTESSRLEQELAEVESLLKTLPIKREKILKQIESARNREARMAAERARREARMAEQRGRR